MAMKNWLSGLAAEAISKSVSSNFSVNYNDINDLIDLLESYFYGINEQVPLAELELKLMFFEGLKKQISENLEKELNNQTIPDSDLEHFIDRFTKIVYTETKTWSQAIHNLHSHVLLRTSGNQKFFPAKDNYLFQLDNLKEFALSILYIPDKNYLINNQDPLEYLKSVPDPFIIEKELVDSILDSLIQDLTPEIVESSKEELQSEHKKNKLRSLNSSFLDGVCGQSCVLA